MINITALNVNGLATDKRAGLFLSILHDRDVGLSSPDILLLQETHLKPNSFSHNFYNPRLFGTAYTVFHAHATTADSHAGVAIAVRCSALVSKPLLISADDSGRWIHVQATVKNVGKISLLSAYAPASASKAERADFLNALPWSELAAQAIVGGDWNCVLRPADWSTTDLNLGEARDSSHKANGPDSAALLLRLHSRRLSDAEETRPHHEFSHTATTSNTRTSSRLDRIYLSTSLSSSLTRHVLLPRLHSLSDHCPVSISLNLDRIPIAKPRWTLDPSILKSPAVRLELQFTASASFASINDSIPLDEWYEELIKNISTICHSAGERLHLKRFASIMKARDALHLLLSAIGPHKASNAQLAELIKCKEDLREAEDAHFGASTHRRFVHLLRTGEASKRHFFARFKARPNRTPIAHIASAASTSRSDTLAAVEKYYAQLHRRPPCRQEDSEFFLSKIVPRVSPEMAQALDAPLTRAELTYAAKKLQCGKATGLDGFPPDLYQHTPSLIDSLLYVWEQSIARGYLPRVFRTAAVSLIYKKGPADSLDNYRPISVLPTAYKIVTKALALRLAKCMCSIVPPNQAGFIKSRDIRTNILEAHLTKAFLSDYAVPGAMLLVDFVKAYDTLSREFLLDVMQRLGFGPNLLRAIFTLHNFTFAVFVVNNFHTAAVQLLAGVCQGCPLAPLLFALATVAFIDATNLLLPPLSLPGLLLEQEGGDPPLPLFLRDSFYADDLTLFLASREAFNIATDLLTRFGRASGLMVSASKTLAYRAPLCPWSTDPYRALAQDEFVALLGSRFGRGKDATPVWDIVEAKIRAKIERFQPYKVLGIFGRSLLAKACLLSHIWFPASISTLDSPRLEQLFKTICRFVHHSTPGFAHLSYANSRRQRQLGGLGIIDPRLEVLAIHAHRVAMLLTSKEKAPWRSLLWLALHSAHFTSRPADLLAHHWSATDFSQPTLGSDLLIAWAALLPKSLPAAPRASKWSFSTGGKLHVASLPPIPSCTAVTICDDVPLEKLTVKIAYKFLLAADFEAHSEAAFLDGRCTKSAVIKPPKLLDAVDDPFIRQRWKWLGSSPLPAKVRQSLWRRWHDCLWLGPTAEPPASPDSCEPAPAPAPKCPYANHSDSLAHFAVDCPIVATPAHRYLTQCWRLWSGSAPEPAWLKCEWAGVNRGWMLAFACLHHALYAGRMHRLDEAHANDSALALLLYVLALFRKLINGMAEAAVGMIKDPDSLTRRLKKLRWPEKWCNNNSFSHNYLHIAWPPLPGAAVGTQ